MNKLQILLKTSDLTISEIAKRLGLATNTVRNWANGYSKGPSYEVIPSLCKVLGISIEDLFDDNQTLTEAMNREVSRLNLGQEQIQVIAKNLVKEFSENDR